jgi:hypothetical protein
MPAYPAEVCRSPAFAACNAGSPAPRLGSPGQPGNRDINESVTKTCRPSKSSDAKCAGLSAVSRLIGLSFNAVSSSLQYTGGTQMQRARRARAISVVKRTLKFTSADGLTRCVLRPSQTTRPLPEYDRVMEEITGDADKKTWQFRYGTEPTWVRFVGRRRS